MGVTNHSAFLSAEALSFTAQKSAGKAYFKKLTSDFQRKDDLSSVIYCFRVFHFCFEFVDMLHLLVNSVNGVNCKFLSPPLRFRNAR